MRRLARWAYARGLVDVTLIDVLVLAVYKTEEALRGAFFWGRRSRFGNNGLKLVLVVRYRPLSILKMILHLL